MSSTFIGEDRDSPLAVPMVSVIIPVRNRHDLLVQTLEALDAQTFRDFEVIVVDDGSSDGSKEFATASVVVGRPVRTFSNPGRGAVAARKYACEQSQAPLLAFTDSDCRPSPQWLDALVRAAIESSADLVSGPTVAARAPRPLERTMVSSGTDGGYPTCNVLYRRAVFDRAGGFVTGDGHPLEGIATTTSLNAGFWEDTLMGWRLRRAGAVPAFAPDAIVYHQVFAPDIPDLFRRSWNLAACASVVKLIPEMKESHLRQHLLFKSRERGLLPVIALSLALRRFRGAAMVTALWAMVRLREHSKAGTDLKDALAALPIEFGVDAVEVAAVACGQFRARTFVL